MARTPEQIVTDATGRLMENGVEADPPHLVIYFSNYIAAIEANAERDWTALDAARPLIEPTFPYRRVIDAARASDVGGPDMRDGFDDAEAMEVPEPFETT